MIIIMRSSSGGGGGSTHSSSSSSSSSSSNLVIEIQIRVLVGIPTDGSDANSCSVVSMAPMH